MRAIAQQQRRRRDRQDDRGQKDPGRRGECSGEAGFYLETIAANQYRMLSFDRDFDAP